MSAPRGLESRHTDVRAEWLNHALCCATADRGAAEDAIADLYALLDLPPPTFIWEGSPAAAARILPAPHSPRYGGPWPVEFRLASLVSKLRERLDRRVNVHSLLDLEVRELLRRIVRESIAGPIRAAASTQFGIGWYGQHEVDWLAYYDVHRRVTGARFSPADTAQLELWATLARSCGWWWPREDFCVITERPTAIRTEPMNGEPRLHNAAGPAVTFPDGWAVHSWHGTRVPSWVIDGPTVELIAAEGNVEVRRCAIERMGWAAFIDQAGLTLVGRAFDPGNPGCELRLYDLAYQQWGSPTRLLIAVNGSMERDGTRRRYGLRVPPWFDNPIDAAGWSYGLTGAQYAQLHRRT